MLCWTHDFLLVQRFYMLHFWSVGYSIELFLTCFMIYLDQAIDYGFCENLRPSRVKIILTHASASQINRDGWSTMKMYHKDLHPAKKTSNLHSWPKWETSSAKNGSEFISGVQKAGELTKWVAGLIEGESVPAIWPIYIHNEPSHSWRS